jgi:hypothetical protein
MAENSTKPAADTRAWESVPGSIWLDAPKASSANSNLSSVSVTYDGNTFQPDLTGKLGSCSVAWVRTSAVPDAHADKTEKIDSTAEAKARLKSFQAHLPELFEKADAS